MGYSGYKVNYNHYSKIIRRNFYGCSGWPTVATETLLETLLEHNVDK